MINREQGDGFTRKRASNPVSYPLPKGLSTTNYSKTYQKYKNPVRAVVFNEEIEANKIITNVRTKNAFKQNATTTVAHEFGVPKMSEK